LQGRLFVAAHQACFDFTLQIGFDVIAQTLQATAEKIKAHIEELASSYEKPAEVVRWYYSDMTRLGEVEAMVIENNVTEYILSHAKVNEKTISFDELMGQQ